MSSDINVQTFSGKVNITSNLLVGTSHLFVDTINNRVGLVTNTPDAGLHVNSNAYVHTNFRVGSGIVMNDTTGRITAGSFVGDGSAMTGINSDSGSWVNGTNSNVHLATSTDKVGIGTTNPVDKFHLYGSPIIQHSSTDFTGSDNSWYIVGTWDATGPEATQKGGTLHLTFLGGQLFGSNPAGKSEILAKVGNGSAHRSIFWKVEGEKIFTDVRMRRVSTNDYKYDICVKMRHYTNHTMRTECSRTTSFERKFTSTTEPSSTDTTNVELGIILPSADTNGSLGIGTTSPGEKLHVNGDLRIGSSPNDTVDDDNNREISTAGQLTIKSNDSGLNGSYVNLILQSGKTNPGKIVIGGGTTDQYRDVEFYTSGSSTERMRIHHNGNVGIGTTDPKTRLHVNHDLHLEASSEAWNTTVGKGLYLRYSLMGGQDTAYIQSVDRSNTSLSYPMIFQASSYQFSVGDVGIGKTPSEKLHVHENLSTSGHQIMARIGGDTSSYNTLVFGSKEGRPHIGGHRGDFGAWADLSFQNDLMILQQSTDRVGIGTSGPSGKLHIYEPTGTSHGVNVGTLILDHGNNGGSSSIVFPSRVNNTSDYAYITYNENYGEAGVSSSENGVLLLGAENDGTGSSDHVRVKTRLVVEADMTSSDPTYAFQVKSSNTTSDLFAVHRDGSIGINGIDLAVPLTINSNKTAVLGGSTRYTTYCRWYRGFGNWWIGSDNNTTWNHNLYWFANVNLTGNPLRKVITFENDQEKGTVVNVNTFTGQHRNIVKGVNPTSIESFIGLIVSADNNENIKVNGGVERGLEAITINETIPLVSVTTKAYDKRVFGVVSGSEDPDSRQDTYGRVTCSFLKEEGDDRIFINSLGEGAMWISNQNGPLESGDYVTSSHIPGYGMKQDSEFLANYTVAKITMDCDFQVTPRVKYRIKTELKTVNYFRHEESFLKESDYNKLEPDTQSDYTLEQYDENVNILDEYGQLQWEDSSETEAPYKVRYLLPDGTQISEEEYTTKALANEEVYIAAFVGCTYHCG